jgi:hypothetical protein
MLLVLVVDPSHSWRMANVPLQRGLAILPALAISRGFQCFVRAIFVTMLGILARELAILAVGTVASVMFATPRSGRYPFDAVE